MRHTVGKIFDAYLHSPDFARLKGGTQKDYETHLRKAGSTPIEHNKHFGNYRANKLEVRHAITAYENWLTSGVRSANYRKACVSAAWKYGMRTGMADHNPISLVRTVSTQPRRVMWQRDQVKKFLETAYNSWNWRNMGLIVQMSYEWGQRVGDMRLLTWDNVNLDECRLDIVQSKRGAAVHLPIGKSLCRMLHKQKEDFGFQKYVAPRVTAENTVYYPYNKSDISRITNEILEEAGLPSTLTAMDLRRTAVTEMMEGDVDIIGIMQVTGHKSATSLRPYMVNTFRGAAKALAARGNDDDEDEPD